MKITCTVILWYIFKVYNQMTTYEYIVQQREREENDYSTDVPPSSQREKKKVPIHTDRKYNISC